MMDTFAERTEITPSRSQPPVLKKQGRSIAEKRRIVEETLAEGRSVARVARAHGVNANQVFQWRRLYYAGRLGPAAVSNPLGQPRKNTIKLLPVTVEAPPIPPPALDGEPSTSTVNSSPGSIHIKLGHAQIRIEGHADPALLRTVLESLRG